MEAFYSIIYYKVTPLTDEYIALGLFVGGGEGPWCYVSESRMKFLKKIIPSTTFLSLKRHLKALQSKVDRYRNEQTDLLLFDPHYSIEEMERLHKVTEGSIVYAKPTTLNKWLDENLYNQLVMEFLGDKPKEKKAEQSSFQLKWNAFYKIIQSNEIEKNVLLSNLTKKSDSKIKLDLVNRKKKKIYKGIDFDWSDKIMSLKLEELEIVIKTIPQYKVVIIFQMPTAELAKKRLTTTKEQFKKVKFTEFLTFKNTV